MVNADTTTQVNFVKNRIISIDERDKKVWELITDVPKLNKVWAIAVFILNIVVPGN